ncbi:MAG TPA: hypothetical protein ACFYD3_03075 [Candidatus Hypogeohydataceae bacterium YC41]
MKAYEEFLNAIKDSETIRRIARTLGSICEYYLATQKYSNFGRLGGPFYDVEALLSSSLIEGQKNYEYSSVFYEVKPSEKGLEIYKKLKENGFYKELPSSAPPDQV